MKQIPVWPVVSNANASRTWKASQDTPLAPDPVFCSETVAQIDCFVNPDIARKFSSQLHALGVQKMDLGTFFRKYVQPGVRAQESGQITSYYVPFLKKLGGLKAKSAFTDSGNKETIVGTEPIAIDGKGTFRKVGDLYSHEIACFQAAFRDRSENEERFLHPELRSLPRELWSPYLKTTVNTTTFLECARCLEARLSTGRSDKKTILEDAKQLLQVLQYELCRSPAIQQSEEFWRSLGKIKFIPIKQFIPPKTMSNKKLHLEEQANGILTTLSTCVVPSVANICWSVHPICEVEINAHDVVGQKFPYLSRPSFAMVAEHLQNLSTMCSPETQDEVREHVKDVEDTYKYLDETLFFGRTGILSGLGDIWLNINIGDEVYMSGERIAASWVPTKKLCIGLENDTEKMQSPKNFLLRYRKLLVAADVKTLKRPKVIKRESISQQGTSRGGDYGSGNSSQEYASTLLTTYNGFRRTGTLCDVVLEVKGQRFPAHRLVLASTSEYWKAMFTINMKEKAADTVPLKEILPKTVSTLLHYIYTGSFVNPILDPTPDPDNDDENLDSLLDLLEASNLWLMDKVKAELEVILATERWIKPGTVKTILDIAGLVRAHELERVCTDYIIENREVVESIAGV